jgi:hypothetical protein
VEGRGGQPRVTVDDLVPSNREPLRPSSFTARTRCPRSRSSKRSAAARARASRSTCSGDTTRRPSRRSSGPATTSSTIRPAPSSAGPRSTTARFRPSGCPSGRRSIRTAAASRAFVYNRTVDYMRRVSEHVFIGEATREGREMDSYFVIDARPALSAVRRDRTTVLRSPLRRAARSALRR